MEKLIEKYNKECNLTSKVASRLWKVGQIVLLSIFSIYYYVQPKNLLINFLLLIIFMLVLYFFCAYIEIRNISNILKMKKVRFTDMIFRKEEIRKIYRKFDIFQKNWITEYCKNNKINSIQKLKILREELQQKQNSNIIKYIDPILIGTLLLAIWEIVVQNISKEIGIASAILICIFSAIIISIIIGWLKKEWQEQKKFMSMFNEFSGNARLNNLLLYRILKSNR